LESLFETERLFFVPQNYYDFTGHVDGMARFINEDTVLINDLSVESPEYQTTFRMALHNAGLKYLEIPYCPDQADHDAATGLYINYLEMQNTIIVPLFGIKSDDIAVSQFENIFNGYQVHTVNCNEIAKLGGVLNCISWNIKT